ncbi:MAG TPA: sulfite exporter TauE/SafE family protein [Steroidobacteraceae bacterium]|nr:sulfite exporter TauE/SafE family protein [Steroidobacteraceae bacterium]
MNGLTLGAALLLGFAASGHCLVMCGGISAALGMAAAKDSQGRTRLSLIMAYQLGRVFSYALAGLMLAGILGGLVSLLDIDSVRRTLRALTALALLLGALVAFGGVRDPGSGIGRRLWPKLAPLGRRLLPIRTLPRGFAFGMVWGWMPCGFVYSVLLIATLQLDAVQGALVMIAFGVGTVPALFIAACGAQRFSAFATRPVARHVGGSVLLLSAVLTLAGPWIEHAMPGLHAWLPFDCQVR